MTFRRTYAWILLAIAILLWAGVVYASRAITQKAEASAADIVAHSRQQQSASETQRLKVLAESTKPARDQLSKIAGADIVSIADTLENVGKRTGVSIQVDDAIPDNSPIAAASAARPFVFVVRGEGTFAQVMQAARLFELLPLPSAVQQIEFERSVDNGSWRIAARIRVYTSATISL